MSFPGHGPMDPLFVKVPRENKHPVIQHTLSRIPPTTVKVAAFTPPYFIYFTSPSDIAKKIPNKSTPH